MEDLILQLVVQYPWLTIPVIVICVLGYAWTQIRPMISPATLEKLPGWLVWLLEKAAGNRKFAENLLATRTTRKGG